MKTAMQELIEHLDIEMKQKGIIPNWNMYLEKEKEQIIKSHIDGFDYIVAEFKKQEYAEEYFNKTYKNQTP
jgi:hypothetical protein